MILTWMVGSIVFAVLAAIAALAAERALVAAGQSRRWPWLFALAASTIWPLAAGIVFLLRSRVLRLPAAVITAQSRSAVATMAARLPAFDPTWIDAIARAFIVLWVAASTVLLARLVIGIVRLRRVRTTSAEHDVDGMRVLVTDTLGPAVYGALNPRIVIPRWLLELEPALRALVLAHEHQHRVRGDAAVIVAGALATALVPWNPAIWLMVRRMRLAVELDCDGRVVGPAGDTERYSKLLLLIAQRQSLTGLVPMLAESNAHLETRIANMNSPRRSRSYGRAAAFGALAIGIVAIACSNKVMADVTAPTPMSATRLAALPQGEKVFFEFQVEKPVRKASPTTNPRYPDILKTAGVEGEVLAQYVVDENGMPMVGTLKILKSTHALFVKAVQDALPNMRFTAAEVNGRKVKQLVQQPFVFALAGSRSSLELMRPDTGWAADSGWVGGKGPRKLGPVKVTGVPTKRP